MSNLIQAAGDQLREKVGAALRALFEEGTLPQAELPAFAVEIPADKAHGDFACNAAMVSAKAFKNAPRRIAEAVCAKMDLAGTYFDRCEVAGPGFLNFFVSDRWFGETLQAIAREGADYGKSDAGAGQKVMVEFVSANPTGPMHIGNARGGAIGDCLASVLECAGYDVTREFYVNDAGNQIQKFGISLEARYLQLFKGEENVPFPEDAYHGEDIKVHAKNFAAQYGDQFVEADAEQRRKALVEYALPINVANLRADLERYRIRYDVWFMESSLHASGAVQETIDRMKQRGLTYEKDGALWYKASAFGSEKDEVLVRANGYPTYFAVDIAYHWNKFAVRGFDRVINVWGADHHGHVARLKGAMDAIGLSGDKLDIVLMQLVRLMRDGETVKVSKRSGKSITLVDLLEEVPIDAARFFFNLREPNSHFDFDLGLAVEQSSQNPVYYVQYAHARICSIVKNLAGEGIAARACSGDELAQLRAPEERELIRHLAAYTREIEEAAKVYDPARMTRYAVDLATLFHKFYNACRVKGEAEGLLQARLQLCICTRTVLKNVLSLLKIEAPEVM